MRTLILSLATAGAALVFTTPAAAQYYPQQQSYGYPQQSYGRGYQQPVYGYNGYGQTRNLLMRADSLRHRVADLTRSRVLRGYEAQQLASEARKLQRQVRQTSPYGMQGFASANLQQRIERLERRVASAASAGRYGNYGYNGYNRGYDRRGYGDPNAYGREGYGHNDNRDDDHDRYGGDRHGDDDDSND
ncbi:MAG: hypothetical protein ABIW33_07285 [Sphingomicrobium sp.]